MSNPHWQFASFGLTLLAPIHAGSCRAGMVAQTHRFVPGHLFSYALAAVYGGQQGARPEDYAQALQTVLTQVRFAPALLVHQQRLLYPVRDEATIEQSYLYGNNHVTLDLDSRSAQDSALFEVEYLAAHSRGAGVHATQLAGGCWYQSAQLENQSWQTWLNQLLLGGELKMGYGRCRVDTWEPGAETFHGLGKIQEDGLYLPKGSCLPGPALNGVNGVRQQPWVGRLHDAKQGFGRRMSVPVLVTLDGVCANDSVFIPHNTESGLGCWTLHS